MNSTCSPLCSAAEATLRRLACKVVMCPGFLSLNPGYLIGRVGTLWRIFRFCRSRLKMNANS
jgi:hypothetical protein